MKSLDLIRNAARLGLSARWAALILAAGFGEAASGDLFSSTNITVNQAIPDNNPSGLSSSADLKVPFGQITDLKVDLNISGTFNGDLYGYLTHDSGFSVLLDRPGRTASSSLGYGDPGMNIQFSDDAANGDIHTYRATLFGDNNHPLSGPLSGAWAPDARKTDPAIALDTDPRTAFLGSFKGLDPNGHWTLFLADVSSGGTSTLNSWGLEITGVPEPATDLSLLAGLGALLIAFSWRRARRRV